LKFLQSVSEIAHPFIAHISYPKSLQSYSRLGLHVLYQNPTSGDISGGHDNL